MRLRHVARGGIYVRVADPDWIDPLDGSFARAAGGRFNPPGSFPVVYLNATLAVARANVLRRFEGWPFGVEDLRGESAPDLVETEVEERRYVDLVTDLGCRAAGLPSTYPRRRGRTVPWGECQPIGLAAWVKGEAGIAARSAVPGLRASDEELAWFDRGTRLPLRSRRKFADWFWPK